MTALWPSIDPSFARDVETRTPDRFRPGLAGHPLASSPHGVTAAHFDIEQSFCVQLQGTRTLGFGRFADEEQKAREVERYWNGSFGRFHEQPETVAEHAISPGTGCYIPPYTPTGSSTGTRRRFYAEEAPAGQRDAADRLVVDQHHQVHRVPRGTCPATTGGRAVTPGAGGARSAARRPRGSRSRRGPVPSTAEIRPQRPP